MQAQRESKPASGDMMDHYRTTYLECHGPMGVTGPPRNPFNRSSVVQPVSGYSANQKPFSAVFDAVHSRENVPLTTTSREMTSLPHSSTHIPRHSGVQRPFSDFATSPDLVDPTVTVKRAHRPFAESNNTLSYQDRDAHFSAIPTVGGPVVATGYTLNNKGTERQSFDEYEWVVDEEGRGHRVLKPHADEYNTTYGQINEAPYLRNPHENVEYRQTLNSHTSYVRDVTEPPCLGVGSDESRVYMHNREPVFKNNYYPNGQPKAVFKRGVDPRFIDQDSAPAFTPAAGQTRKFGGKGSTSHLCAGGAEILGHGSYPYPYDQKTTSTLYTETFVDPALKPTLAETMTNALTKRETERLNMTRASAPVSSNPLLRTGKTTYSQTFIQHPTPLPL